METINTDRAVPNANCLCRLSNISRKAYRDTSRKKCQKGLNDGIVFNRVDSIIEILDHVLQFKGEIKKVINKIVKYSLYILAHKGSGFDCYEVLNNLPQWRTLVSLVKNGSSIVSHKLFNGLVDQNKKNSSKCAFLMRNSSYYYFVEKDRY